MLSDKKPARLTKKDIIAKGSVVAIIITMPSLAAFFVGWYILDDLLKAAIIGAVIHFIAMGFSFKIIKKFFVKKSQLSEDL